ncbi:MAG: hypothetical protein LBL59_08220 [Xanthomonadaceae bacterium]|nr:hypothetical protein [Xanthomonadaceae bacterium]
MTLAFVSGAALAADPNMATQTNAPTGSGVVVQHAPISKAHVHHERVTHNPMARAGRQVAHRTATVSAHPADTH